METRYYEGCGREGPIRCIFLCEFHPVAGPKISCQFPDEYLSKETFDAISVYIIPKPQLQKCIMTINAFGHKVIGYSIRIDSQRYERNAYLFNVCFVFDSWSRTVQYEPVVKKLAEHLTILEEESRFVSSGSTRMPTLLAHLMHDLNAYRKATVGEGDTVIHLKVLEVRKDPPVVHDHDVPVIVSTLGPPRPTGEEEEEPYGVLDMDTNRDLTTQQLMPYIDGYNHISKIAAEADVEKALVKACIQNLLYYGVVVLVPILKFSNMYRATPSLSRLFRDVDLQKACLNYCSLKCSPKNSGTDSEPLIQPHMCDVLQVLCSLQQGTPLRAVCSRSPPPHAQGIDARRLVLFATVHGLVRPVKRYPIYVQQDASPDSENPEDEGGIVKKLRPKLGIYSMFTGKHCVDEICCSARLDILTLEQIIEDDPDVISIWR